MHAVPRIVLGELRAAAAPRALEGLQPVRTPAALAEAQTLAGARVTARLDVHVADAALLVVRTQALQQAGAALRLCSKLLRGASGACSCALLQDVIVLGMHAASAEVLSILQQYARPIPS